MAEGVDSHQVSDVRTLMDTDGAMFLVRHGQRITSMLCFTLLFAAAGCSGESAPSQRSTSTSHIAPSVPITTSTSPEQRTMLERIAFFNPGQGYGLFERRSAGDSKCSWLVAKTTDGGAHFAQDGAVDSWPCADSPNATSLAFDDHGDGFLYGPKLFVTHDDGATWTPQPETGTVTAVSALGNSVWMVEGVCPADASSAGSTCPLQLLESSDGGRSWTPSPSPVPGADASTGALTLEPAQSQSWLQRVGQSPAYVASNPTPNVNGSADTVPLWHTSDGGSSWTRDEIPCGVDALSAAMSLAPDGTLIAVCAAQPSAGAQPKSTSTSTDGGRSWIVRNTCPGSISPQCMDASSLNFGYLAGIDALSAQIAFLVGARSSLMVTRDGGSTWHPVEPVIGGTDAGTDQVIFFDAHHGVVLGIDSTAEEPAIWTTNDGGSSWSEFVPTIK